MRPRASKKELIKSLEKTLRFAKAGIIGLRLYDKDSVEITFNNGDKRKVNIREHSGIDIIQKVTGVVDIWK